MIRQTLVVIFLALLAAVSRAQSREFHELTLRDGRTLRYALVLPDGFDAARPYPLLIALPPGNEDERMVEEGLRRYWEAQARQRGWAVLSPAAPAGRSLSSLDSSEVLALMKAARERVKIRDRKAHLAGVSNGGRAAFEMAAARPEQFASLVVLPGVPRTIETFEYDRLRALRVWMFVGERDEGWLANSRAVHAKLLAAGVQADLRVRPGEGHVLSVAPSALFDLLEEAAAAGQTPHASEAEKAAEVQAALDDFHDAASKADEARYFGHFAPGAVFLGTDITERWTAEEFRAWARPYFQRGTAWTYTPLKRRVYLSPGGDTAWFDETLENARLGECRGSGVLVLRDGVWRLTQYHLVLPVPNEIADEVVQRTKELREEKGAR
ncbi:MAG: nuclear transport factor 2 family protein [Phycisphaeraceae bacterium]|nr:nuclear transport factor 2 family protein [Phycisphaeraceae bacterium]